MNNVSDFQFHLMAVKNNVVYPVMLTTEQYQMLHLYVMALGKVTVLNNPQGIAENLKLSLPKATDSTESA